MGIAVVMACGVNTGTGRDFADLENPAASARAFTEHAELVPNVVSPVMLSPPTAAVETSEYTKIVDETQFADETVASLVLQERIIIRTVYVSLVVDSVLASLDSVTALAQEFGGWVVSSSRSEKHFGSISLRVPAEELGAVIIRLRDMAVEVESEISTSEDVTEEYVDTRARLESLQAERDSYILLFESAKDVDESLKVRQALTEVQVDIEVLQGRINLLERTSAFSLINVDLRLEPAEMFVTAGQDQTAGVGDPVRFRAFFNPPDGIGDFQFTWDFGDGSPVVTSDRTAPTKDGNTRVTATVTHFYFDELDSPFFAKVKIIGSGKIGIAENDDTLVVTVTKIPSIEVFAGDSITVEEGQEIEFSGSFTRPEGVTDVKFKWDFGDGSAPVIGDVADGATNADAMHSYTDHRPFPFLATLTITAQSDAGEVETSGLPSVWVTASRGWIIAGWSAQDQGKTAVRTLSGVGQVGATMLIWVVILSPAWVIAGVLGVLMWRRRGSRSRINFLRKKTSVSTD